MPKLPKLYRDATTGQYTTAEDAAARPAETVPETVEARHETPDVAELRDQIAGTIHRRICEHSREDCIENLGKCERATDSAMPLISTALDEGHAMARLLADALKDAIRTLRELAEKAAGEPIPFGDSDLYAEVVDGALDAAAERDRLAEAVERVRALHGPRVLQVLGATCSAEECDHEDACPLVDYTVCGHCYDVGDGAHPYAYEDGGLQDVAHPCATYRALDATPETGGES